MLTENPNTTTIKSFALSEFGEQSFTIPRYQRLYAWGKEEIEALLNDLWNAYKKGNDKIYYLGALVLNQENEVIDGQQRLTTLSLISAYISKLNNSKNGIGSFFALKDNENREDKTRVFYDGRKNDKAWLKSLIEPNEPNLNDESVSPSLIAGYKIIQEWFAYEDLTISEGNKCIRKNTNFLNFIFTKATLVQLQLSDATDAEEYFESMNSTGEQLANHQVIKAKLLSYIKENSEKYARIWEACSQMNNDIFGFAFKIEGKKSEEKIEIKNYLFNDNLGGLIEKYQLNEQGNNNNNQESEQTPKTTVEDILKLQHFENPGKGSQEDSENRTSIVNNFPLFLLYIQELFLEAENQKTEDKKKVTTFDTKNLVGAFQDGILKVIEEVKEEEKKAEQAKAFILLLFRMRVLFDGFIIARKGNDDHQYTFHQEIFDISNKADGSKITDDREHELFQAMLWASFGLTSSNSWLMAALKALMGIKEAQSEKEVRGKVNTALEDWEKENAPKIPSEISALSFTSKPNRYYFYKLDFALWKIWKTEKNILIEEQKMVYEQLEKFNNSTALNNFQIRQNRSVEHIFPQNGLNQEIDKQGFDNTNIHHFGNLALISSSANSSYKDQLPSDKKLDFLKRVNNNLESLKQAVIFSQISETEPWTYTKAKAHGEAMHAILALEFEEMKTKTS